MRSALLALVAAALLVPAPARAATTLASGVVTDAAGRPAAGVVRVYAWPRSARTGALPLLGTAHAGRDGSFAVSARDPAQLRRLAARERGALDVTAVADTGGHQAEWTFTARVGQDRARAATVTAPPRLRLIARRPAATAATAADHCTPQRETRGPRYSRALTVVGELNNAYNDGTRGTFTYGRESSADTEVGVAMSSDGGHSWQIGGENHIEDSGTAVFPPAHRRYARKLRTLFEYAWQAARNNTCAAWDEYIRATSWIGGTESTLKQRATLDRCLASALGSGFASGSRFTRDRNAAVRYTRGVEVFGVHLTTRSGFSESVTLEYRFRGPRGKPHYLCGPDGKTSPYEAGRVFSGARR